MIYADNAATTWPKPQTVYKAVTVCMESYGANPGRSGHKMAVEAGSILLYTREMLCELFNVKDPFQFVYTNNCTDSLNLAIKGLLKPGDHVITTSMEHNSVIRPLKELERKGVKLTIVSCNSEDELDPDNIEKAVQGNTRLIVTTHASNVTGTIMPVERIGTIARKYGIPYLLDAAQTAGIIPMDLAKLPVDLVAFPGHKSLLGPQGTGALYIGPGIIIHQLKEGGTGSLSESLYQPEILPDRYESGTLNTPGIAGMGAGIRHILKEGQKSLLAKEIRLERLFIEALSQIKGIKLYGNVKSSERTGVISLNINDKDSSEVANILDERYNIAVRGGLHCAPLAHQTLGTYEQGAVRFSFGIYNTLDEVKYCIKALEEISRN